MTKRLSLLLVTLAALLVVPACAVSAGGDQDTSDVCFPADTQYQPVTRAAFADMALDCYYAVGGQAPAREDASFRDCDDPAVTTALNLGLVSGFPDGTFRPEETVTRQQAAVILRRTLTAAEVEIPGLCGTTFANLKDADAVSSWAKTEVSILVNMDIFRDIITDDTLSPTEDLTLAQANALALRFRSVIHSLAPGESGSFAGQLTAALAEKDNLVLSPLSLQMALGLVEPGASGETLSQVSALLAGTNLAGWQQELTKESENGPTLEIANSLWFDTSVTPSEDYLTTLRTSFDAESTTMDLDTGEALTAINTWVKEKTHGLIDKILDRPLSSNTSAVLLNALYFQGDWVTPFDPNQTYDAAFHTAQGDVTVPFLHDTRSNLNYIDTDTCVGAALPYQGNGSWWMLLLLPKEGATPAQLAQEDLGALLESCLVGDDTQQTVRLSLPKFTLEGNYDLTEALEAMGLTAAFDPLQADLSKMGTSAKGPLYLSQVVQKTYLRVDEKGTEAAAVTGAIAEATSAEPEQPIDLTFDSPFLCCLWNTAIGQPVFLAVVDDPS
jgi:serpin B